MDIEPFDVKSYVNVKLQDVLVMYPFEQLNKLPLFAAVFKGQSTVQLGNRTFSLPTFDLNDNDKNKCIDPCELLSQQSIAIIDHSRFQQYLKCVSAEAIISDIKVEAETLEALISCDLYFTWGQSNLFSDSNVIQFLMDRKPAIDASQTQRLLDESTSEILKTTLQKYQDLIKEQVNEARQTFVQQVDELRYLPYIQFDKDTCNDIFQAMFHLNVRHVKTKFIQISINNFNGKLKDYLRMWKQYQIQNQGDPVLQELGSLVNRLIDESEQDVAIIIQQSQRHLIYCMFEDLVLRIQAQSNDTDEDTFQNFDLLSLHKAQYQFWMESSGISQADYFGYFKKNIPLMRKDL